MNHTAIQERQGQLSDQEIIRRVLQGEKRLFEGLIRRYNQRLYRVIMAILKNDADVEDVMQTAYIKAYQHLEKFESRSGFGTWITRIAINESLHQLRKYKQMPMTEHEDKGRLEAGRIGPPVTPETLFLSKELGKELEQSLLELPEKYRLIFVLREMENLSIAETQSVLNITEVNVKVRLNRAKSLLRNKLNQYYKNDQVLPFHLTRCDRVTQAVLSQLHILPSAD
jgi:RNA polymerase sigma factor (sigma-70 family)